MCKGLTIIETVVSIAIISIAVIFAISAFPLGIMLSDLNQKSSVALFLASAQIETIIYNSSEEGLFVEDFGEINNFENYKRETEVTCFSPEGSCISGIKKVKVTVYPRASVNRSISLTTLINE